MWVVCADAFNTWDPWKKTMTVFYASGHVNLHSSSNYYLLLKLFYSGAVFFPLSCSECLKRKYAYNDENTVHEVEIHEAPINGMLQFRIMYFVGLPRRV